LKEVHQKLANHLLMKICCRIRFYWEKKLFKRCNAKLNMWNLRILFWGRLRMSVLYRKKLLEF